MNKKFRLKKGDNVVVLSGESKGLRGRILEMDYKNDTAIVEGVNLMSKHTRPNAKDPKGGIIKNETYDNKANHGYIIILRLLFSCNIMCT